MEKQGFDGKKPNWNALKTINTSYTKAVKSCAKWDAGTGKCSFLSIFAVISLQLLV